MLVLSVMVCKQIAKYPLYVFWSATLEECVITGQALRCSRGGFAVGLGGGKLSGR